MPRFREEYNAEDVETGLWPSVHVLDAPLWTEGKNVVFRDRGLRKQRGWTSAFTKPNSDTVRGIEQQRQNDLTQKLYWGTTSALYQWDTATVTDVSRGGGYNGNVDESVTAPASVWSMVPWGDWMFATNGVDKPQIYKPSNGQFQDLSATFNEAEVFARRGPYVLAINTDNAPNFVEWSDIDDPETWSPTATNNAGNLQFREALGPLRAAAEFGDRLAIYGTETMFLMELIGGSAIYRYEPVLTGLGAVGKMAVASVGQRNFGFGRQGAWMSDGTQVVYIDQPALRRYFQDNINWDQASKIAVWHDYDNEMVLFSIPTGSSKEPDETWGFRYKNNTWSRFDWGRTSGINRDVFAYPIATTDNGDVYFHNTGTDADGSALPARIRTKPLLFNAPGRAKMLTRLRHLLRDTSGTGLRVRVGAQNKLRDRIDWSAWKQIDETVDPVDFRKTGEYLIYEFEATKVGDTFALSGLLFEGEKLGKRI